MSYHDKSIDKMTNTYREKRSPLSFSQFEISEFSLNQILKGLLQI